MQQNVRLSDINEVTALVRGGQGSSEVAVPMTCPQLSVSPAHACGRLCVCEDAHFSSSDESFNTKSCSVGCSIVRPGEATCGKCPVPTYVKVAL